MIVFVPGAIWRDRMIAGSRTTCDGDGQNEEYYIDRSSCAYLHEPGSVRLTAPLWNGRNELR
jgi:hypothetical protein